MKIKSERNKTIDFEVSDKNEYLNRVINAKDFDYKDIENKTILGDSLEVMKNLQSEIFNLIIVDPPYNLNKEFNGNKFSEMDNKNYSLYTKKWLIECKRLLKKNGSIYVCCDWKSSLVIGEILDEHLFLRNRITWEREKGRGAKNNWKNSMEDIFFATKTEDYKFNLEAVKILKKVIAPYKENGKPKDWEENSEGKFRETCPSNFWDDISVPYWSMAENTAHPTQKPEKLLAKLIVASSDKDDLVFDPFLGSGSTSVTAKKLGRKYFGIEQNKTYCAWAEKRLFDADTDRTIQGFDGKRFYERNIKVKK